MTEPAVLQDIREAVLHVRINAPHRRNALSTRVLHELRSTVAGAQAQSATAIVLSGVQTFSSGADLAELTGTSADLAYDDTLAGTIDAVLAAPMPVLAAIEGPCIGAAVDLALAADLRIAGESAWLRVPAVQLGLLYNPAAIARMHRALPRTTVSRLLIFAERFSAADALAAGLISHVVPDGAAVHRAHAIATAVAQHPADAVQATKELLAGLDHGAVDDAHWQRVRENLLASPQRQKAVADAQRRTSARSTPEATQ